jgi:hypothetical protein
MVTKTQIIRLSQRIKALAAIRGPQRTIIVAGDETVEQALQRSGGGNPDDCIFVLTGVPRGYGERA